MHRQERSQRRTKIDVLPRKGEHESTRHHEKASANRRTAVKGRARIDEPPRKGECESTHHRKRTQTSAKAELGTRHRNRVRANLRCCHEWHNRGELATLKGTSPGNPHQATPKSVRRWHYQQQNSHAPWPILLSSYPTIEEPSGLVRISRGCAFQ